MKRLTVLAAAALFVCAAHAEEVTLTGAAAFEASQKSTCGTLQQGQTRYGVFEGRGYSRVPGEKDRHLFNLLGINVRQCSVVEDETRGRGYRSVSREIMIYMDPHTSEILDRWPNPWTGKEIEVIHVANDPVNMRAYRYEKNEQGEMDATRTLRVYGNVAASSAEVPLFYNNPLGSEFQDYVGGKYHAMEMFNSFYDSAKIMDAETQSIGDSHLAWSRVAQWLPWLEMGDKPGIMIFNATGFSTFDKARVPPRLVEILNERYPDYWAPPPLDDKRPNETSWTVFRKHLEARAETAD